MKGDVTNKCPACGREGHHEEVVEPKVGRFALFLVSVILIGASILVAFLLLWISIFG